MISAEALSEWAVNYAKNRDIMANEITSIDTNGGRVTIKKGEKSEVYVIKPVMADLQGVSKEEATVIVTLNTKKSLDFVISAWKELSEMPKLKIIFANPDSTKDKKWILAPHIHNRICDKSSLKTGLSSMFEGVDEVRV